MNAALTKKTVNKTTKVYLQDIAREADVSYVTASRVLNNHDNVNSKTRERVQRILDKHHYTRKNRLKAVAETHVIDLVFHETWRTNLAAGAMFFSKAITGIERILKKFNCHLTVQALQGSTEVEYLERLATNKFADGAIMLYYDSRSADFLDRLRRRRVPCVLIQPQVAIDDAVTVAPDNYQGATQAVKHLMAMGHRRIAHIRALEGHCEADERHNAYFLTLVAGGIEPLAEYTCVGNGWNFQSGYQAMERLMSLPQPPTAVFADDDSIAIGAMNYCTTRGIGIPEQVSIVGFDDMHPDGLTVPALTTVNYDVVSMVEIASLEIISQIEYLEIHPKKILTPTRLIERDSVRRME